MLSAPPPPCPLLLGGVAALTVIGKDCVAEVPSPVHVSVKVVFAVSAALAAIPDSGCEPVQPPDAVHESVFTVVHLS